MRVDEHTTTIDGVPVFYRSATDPGTPTPRANDPAALTPRPTDPAAPTPRPTDPAAPTPSATDAPAPTPSATDPSTPTPSPPSSSRVLYLHDALTSSDDLVAFLERTGGVAPDLIGFGRSGKGGHLDYSPQGLADFVDRFLAHLGIERLRLVGHGWGGAAGLLVASRRPELVERLALINPVPLLPGFAWHGPPQLWRRPVLGELTMGSTPRWLLARELRRGSVSRDAWSRERLAQVWAQFDHGTQRALLRLHRAADASRLAELGSDLGTVRAPTLILWGDADPWLGAELADAYGRRLPNATVEHIPGAGHWPWLDQPQAVDVVVDFLARS